MTHRIFGIGRQFKVVAIPCLLLAGVLLAPPPPARAATLVTHYDATALGLSAGDTGNLVANWTDSSGNANHATKSTSATEEGRYQHVGVGGQPSIEFTSSGGADGDGYQSAQNMGTYGITNSTGWSMIFVMRATLYQGAYLTAGGLGSGNTPNGGAITEFDPVGGNSRFDIAGGFGHDVVLRDQDGSPDDTWYDSDSTNDDLMGVDVIITMTHENSANSMLDTTALFINGWSPGQALGLLDGMALESTGNANTTPFILANAKMSIGASPNVSGKGFDGLIAEVLVYDDELTTSERMAIEYSLSQKYGISGDFPNEAPIVTNRSSSVVSNNAVTMRGELIINDATATIRFYYGFSDGNWVGYSQLGSVQQTGTVFETTVTGLEYNTNYVFRAFATNSLGSSLAANLMSFDTGSRETYLVTHYDASALTGYTNGQDVLTWPDLIYGNHAIAIAQQVADKPKYQDGTTDPSNGIGGKPTIRFQHGGSGAPPSGSGYTSTNTMGTYGITNDAGWTMIWVVKEVNSQGQFSHIGGIGFGGIPGGLTATTLEIENLSGNAEHRFDIATGYGHDVQVVDTDGTPNDTWQDDGEPSTDLTRSNLIITVTHDDYTGGTAASTLNLFINGWSPNNGLLAGKVFNATGNTATGALNIRDDPIQIAGAISRGFDGVMAEVLIYDNALTTEEREAIEYSLSQKYGISGNFSAPPEAPTGTIIVIR